MSDKKIEFVEWSSENSNNGDVFKVWVQYTGNEDKLKQIHDFIMNEELPECVLNLNNLLTEKEVNILTLYGGDESKGVYIEMIEGKLKLPTDGSWKEEDGNPLYYTNMEEMFVKED